MVNESINGLKKYFLDNGYSDLEVFNDGIDKYLLNTNGFKKFEKGIEFKKREVDYSELNSNLDAIKDRKRYIDKRVKIEDRKRNGSLLDKIRYSIGDFFVFRRDSNLENVLESQKKQVNYFSDELKDHKSDLKDYFSNLNSGFSNLCYSWIKVDSLINKYEEENFNYKDTKRKLNFFSWRVLSNIKKSKKLKSQILKNKEKINVFKNKIKDIQSSFKTYKTLFDKNQSDDLFLYNLNRELVYQTQLLGFSGNQIIDVTNYNGNSLNSLKALREYTSVNRNEIEKY